MGLLSRIFRFKRSESSDDTKVSANYPDEYKQILKFRDSLNSILGKDRFIARSDYDGLVKEYSPLPPFIDTLKKSKMLKTYVESNNLDLNVIERFSETYIRKTLTHEFVGKSQIFELKSQNRKLNSLLCEIFTYLAVKIAK